MAIENSNPFKNEEVIKDEENMENNENSTEPEEQNSSQDEAADSIDNNLQEEYDKLNRQYIRLAADFDNYRKRQAQERESLLKFGTENALRNLIEVLDNFERGQKALENVEDEHKEHTVIEELQKGYKMGDRVLRPTLVNVATSAG